MNDDGELSTWFAATMRRSVTVVLVVLLVAVAVGIILRGNQKFAQVCEGKPTEVRHPAEVVVVCDDCSQEEMAELNSKAKRWKEDLTFDCKVAILVTRGGFVVYDVRDTVEWEDKE